MLRGGTLSLCSTSQRVHAGGHWYLAGELPQRSGQHQENLGQWCLQHQDLKSLRRSLQRYTHRLQEAQLCQCEKQISFLNRARRNEESGGLDLKILPSKDLKAKENHVFSTPR